MYVDVLIYKYILYIWDVTFSMLSYRVIFNFIQNIDFFKNKNVKKMKVEVSYMNNKRKKKIVG